jgi:Carboxypeptidase regulatory-like domain/TonB dependent receptor
MRQRQGSRRAVGLTLILSGSVSLPLAAQAITTAALYGVVTGRDSAGIEEAVVTVTNAANGERWRTVTATGGRYLVEYLSLGGPYTVEARAVGYGPMSRTGIMLSLGERHRADLSLTPVILELPEIEVAGTIDPVLNAGRTGPAQTIDERLTSGLPLLDRDFSQLAFLSPQAIRTTDQGISVAGQSDRLNNIQIDGANNNDAGGISGTFGSGTIGGSDGVRTLSAEALQELQVLAAPFDVRYGMFAGGLVNAVTRSGTNLWEGTVSTYFQMEGLTGRDEQGRRAEDFSSKEVGVTLGGPIVRDRLAFFLDAGLQRFTGGRRLAIGTDTTGGADSIGIGVRRSSAERFQTILRDTFGVDPGSITPSVFGNPGGNAFGKVTLWPGLNQRIEVSHNYAKRNPLFIPGGFNQQSGWYDLTSFEADGSSTVNATRLTWTAAGQGRFSNELTASRVAGTERCGPRSHFAQVRVLVDNGGLRAGTNEICNDRFANQTAWELTDNASWLLGSHRITLGTHDELIQLDGKNRSLDLIATGRWTFRSLDSLERRESLGFRRTLPGPGRPEGARSDLEVRQLGLYLQDQWAPLPNLSLTAGLRFDVPFLPEAPVRNTMLADSLGVSTAVTPSGHLLWSPRLGLNYDVGGRGTTFLRGGAGLFSGRPIYLYFSNAYESTGLETLELLCAGADAPAITSLDLDDQPTTCGSGAAAVPVVSVFDRSFRFPRNLRLALGADVRLPWSLVGTADLLYIRGVSQLDFIDLNLAPPTASASGEGGRVLYGTIDPSSGEPFPNRRTSAFGRVAQMRNSSGDRSVSATVQLQKQHRAGELSVAYTYTDARDRISPLGYDLPSNLDLAPLDGTLDRRRLTPSWFEAVHKVTVGGVVDLPARFQLGVFYNGFSGHPFTYLIAGDANADGIGENDILYVPRDASDITLADPTQWAALDGYIRAEPCLQKQRGRIMRRNSCREHWQTVLNARLSSVIPTARGRSIELVADLFNVLNLFDRDWGVQRFHSGALELVGYDEANGRGIYNMMRFDRGVRDEEATRWRLQLGARYGF